jgi:hypothetical protein
MFSYHAQRLGQPRPAVTTQEVQDAGKLTDWNRFTYIVGHQFMLKAHQKQTLTKYRYCSGWWCSKVFTQMSGKNKLEGSSVKVCHLSDHGLLFDSFYPARKSRLRQGSRNTSPPSWTTDLGREARYNQWMGSRIHLYELGTLPVKHFYAYDQLFNAEYAKYQPPTPEGINALANAVR